jgi:hypothetical protein
MWKEVWKSTKNRRSGALSPDRTAEARKDGYAFEQVACVSGDGPELWTAGDAGGGRAFERR